MPGHSRLPCADCVHLSALPGIHVLPAAWQGVDGRDKPGHDGVCVVSVPAYHAHHCPSRSIRAGACTWSAL
ncbi:hypothetical protein CWO89_33445 [Bradyrhizobium sp. Leo170]|nr:hypothetical protein CWO89_33445 [Bradyrhizobium sp. Leo170]